MNSQNTFRIRQDGYKTILSFLEGFLIIIIYKPINRSQIRVSNKITGYVEHKIINNKNLKPMCFNDGYCYYQSTIPKYCFGCKFLRYERNEENEVKE